MLTVVGRALVLFVKDDTLFGRSTRKTDALGTFDFRMLILLGRRVSSQGRPSRRVSKLCYRSWAVQDSRRSSPEGAEERSIARRRRALWWTRGL